MKKLLLYYADDDIDDLNLVKEAAEKYEHTVETFFTGEALLQAYRDAATKPDIIMLDYYMPPSNGIETLKKIRRLYGNIPVVMITGSCSLNMKQNFLDQGASSVVEKPMSFKEQEEVLKKITSIDWRHFNYNLQSSQQFRMM